MNYSLSTAQAKKLITNKLTHFYSVSPEEADNIHFYKAISLILKDMMMSGRKEFSDKAKKKGSKKVCYLSMEFLMGRSLKNTLYNLNLTDTIREALDEFGVRQIGSLLP